MSQWKFFKNIGKGGEYVCTDVGNILKVVLRPSCEAAPMAETRSVEKIITDEDEYMLCGEKKYLPLSFGWEFIDCKDKKGEGLCSDPRVLYIVDRNWEMLIGYHPLKEAENDYIGNMPEELWKARQKNDKKEIERLENRMDECPIKGPFPTQAEWERFCLDIPTREYALEWLKKRGYQIEPVDVDNRLNHPRYGYTFQDEAFRKEIKALDFSN